MAIFVASERAFAPSFQGCINEQQNPKPNSSTEEQPSSFRATVAIYADCSGRFIDAHHDGITALATVVIAAFTCTLWLATSRQAELTKEALIADKRAFVFATGITPMWELDAATNQYDWRIRPNWQNSGDTPTRNLRLYVDSEFRNTALPTNFRFIEGQIPPGTGLLGPKQMSLGGAAPMLPNAALRPQDVVDLINGTRFFYLWGWVRYFDVFPGTDEHVTS